MKIIVLQHIKIEDPGYIKDLMLNDHGWANGHLDGKRLSMAY